MESDESLPREECKICTKGISPEFKAVFILACVFLLAYTAFLPVESLQSSLNSDSGLGTLSLACLYGPYFIFAIAAPAIVRVFTPKWTVFVAFSCDLLYLAANFYPSWYTLIPASVIAGTFTGPLWTAKDLYVVKMSKRSTKKSNRNEEKFTRNYQSKLSFYNGIIIGGLSFGRVFGQLISSLVLSQRSSPVSVEQSCGAFHCAVENAPPVGIYNGTNTTILDSTKPDKNLIYTLLGIFTALLGFALFLTAFGLRQILFEKDNQSLKGTVLSCAVRLTDCRMLLIIPQLLLFGFSHGIISSDYTLSYVTCGKGVGMIGYTLISRGVCSAIASVVCGRLVKYTGRRIQAVMALALYTGVYLMMWFWKPIPSDHVIVYFLVPALFGISDVVFQNHICTMLALIFEDDKAAAFANFYTFRALSKSLSFGLSAFVCVWVKLTIVSVFLFLACLSFVVVETWVMNKKAKKQEVQEEIAAKVMLSKRKQ